MKKSHILCVVLILAIGALLLVVSGCAKPDEGKVPITTKSKEARELYLQGRDLSESLQGQESRTFFEQAVEKDPEFAMAHLLLAFAQPSAKKFFESLDRAVALVDQVSEGERMWIQGVDAGVNGFAMKQREYYQKIVAAYPNDERAYNLLANNYFGQQEYPAAIEQYNKAVEIAPDFSQPYNQLGYAYRFLGNYQEAEEAFQKYIELIPNDPNPYDSYAELLMKMGRYDESIASYKEALTQNPHFVASFIGIATNLVFKGVHQEARAVLQELYDTARDIGERRAAMFATAVSYVDEGNLEKALEEQDRQHELAQQINDPSAMAGDLVVKGNILLELGNLDEALDMYKMAVELIEGSDLSEDVKNNTRRAFLFNAARAALKKEDFETAHANVAEYLDAVTAINNPFQIRLAHQVAGMIALGEEDYDLALAELQQANQQNPYNLYRMALAYQGIGDKENAKDFCEQAAHYNALNNMNYAFCRTKALQMAEGME